MSNVLMLHEPIQLVYKFIIYNVYLSNNQNIWLQIMNATGILAINTASYINVISMATRDAAAWYDT